MAALAETREDADKYLDDLRRVAADFENYRKRTQREMAAIVERASERVVRQLLPVLDSFEAALAVEARTETEEKLLSGLRNTYDLLLDVLIKEGPGADRDLGRNHSIRRFTRRWSPPATAGGPLKVTQEFRRGYKLRGKGLRAALVAVAPDETGPNQASTETDSGPIPNQAI